MSYTEAFRIAARCSFVGLLVGGYFGSLLFSLWLRYEDQAPLLEWLKTPLLAFGVLIFAAGFAVLPVALVGMPTYAWLVKNGRANYWTAVAIAAVFSLVVLALTEPVVASVVALFAICIALVTHQAYQFNRAGSNNSFKPKPLRGSA